MRPATSCAACRGGLEGLVSKHRDRTYRRGRIDTEVDAVDVRELIDTELDTVSGGSFHSTGGPAVAFNTATYTNQILNG